MKRIWTCVTLALSWTICACSASGSGGLPAGMIALFDGECPGGWTRFEALDGRFPRGAAQGGEIGGGEEHLHAFDLTAHTSKDGAHAHKLAAGESIEVDNGFFGHIGIFKGYLQGFEEAGVDRTRVLRAKAETEDEGAHDHLMSVQGDTEKTPALPPYRDVLFCRKD